MSTKQKEIILKYKGLLKKLNLSDISRDEFHAQDGLSVYLICKEFGSWTNFKLALDSSEALSEEKVQSCIKDLDNGEREYSRICYKPLSLEEAIELWNIDTTVYEIKEIKFNQYPIYAKNKEGNLVAESMYQTKVIVKPRTELSPEIALEAFRQNLEQHGSINFSKYKPIKAKGLYYELSLPDLHLGKLAWEQETGKSDYNSKIAVKLFTDAVNSLLADVSHQNVTDIIFPIGNDFFNIDNAKNETTGGTRQDEDSRWQKSYQLGCLLCTSILEKLAESFNVHVIIVPGNHDKERIFYLGDYLKAWFRTHGRIDIDNRPIMRKYFAFGTILLAYTHGKYEKKKELRTIMQSEVPQLWGATTYREIHLGHLHTEELVEENGFKIRRLPSLTAPDAWHAESGYTCNQRSALGLLYDPKHSLKTINYYTI